MYGSFNKWVQVFAHDENVTTIKFEGFRIDAWNTAPIVISGEDYDLIYLR